MAIPEFQKFFHPFLRLIADKKEHSLHEIRELLTNHFSLTDEEKSERIPSGVQTKFDNRIYWTKSYFNKAKIIESTKRSHLRITDRGLKFLEDSTTDFTVKDLKVFPEFREFIQGNNSITGHLEEQSSERDSSHNETKTPLENLEESYQYIRSELALELLDKIKLNSWQFFEDLVIDLMVKMGYGGSRNKAGESIKRNNDEGIDGIINEDKLGLDVIYLQAKLWKEETAIGRPEIQKFVGALHGQRAKKGVFITTSTFAKTAIDYVKSIDSKVILIDGKTLTNLMIEYNVGTTTIETYQIKKIDSDYFES